MEKLQTYEQYSQVLASFKQGRARCATNKMMMRDELTALIEEGKLWYEQNGDTLWFFSDEDYFYYAHLYAPADTPIQMKKQDKDVVVDLMGNESRYNELMEQNLLAAGFEKHDRYVELACQLEDVIETVENKLVTLRKVWGGQGFTCRKAVRADFPELHKLWMEKLGRDSYTVLALTETELDDIERYGRCIVACNSEGEIVASSLYLKRGSICYGYITATNVLGLGGWTHCEKYLSAYQEGCTKDLSWAREDNYKSINMARNIKRPSGKFYWQFVCRAEQ